MVLLRAAALCCLCSALVAMAAELIQEQLSLTRRVGDTASFSCGGIDLCRTYVFWYQKKETETFRVILRINRNNGDIYSGYIHPQIKDFTAAMKNNKKICELKINKVQSSHSASYYCSCYDSHSEKSFLLPEQKPAEDHMSCDRKSRSHGSPPSCCFINVCL
ncbi:immunoglobulin lambda-1 light chain-like [Solea senegalensis]|nr:immunoglobulin lambda-1 light chain-like [Solea senegalensis]